MKIIRVIPFLDFGGLEKRVQLTAIGFQKSSASEFKILVLGSKGKTSEELESIGIEIIHLNHKIKIPNFILIYKLYKYFKAIKPDVVHTSASEANFHGLIAAWMSKVPVRIGEEIGFPAHDKKWKFIFKWVYRTATSVIGISHAVKDKIVEFGEVGDSKVKVVYNPVSLELFNLSTTGNKILDYLNFSEKVFNNVQIKISPTDILNSTIKNEHLESLNDGNKPFVFIITCRLVPIKNLDMLIKVFAELILTEVNVNLSLWIVGDGPERQKLEKLTYDLDVSKVVTFWGFQEQVSIFLLNADAFVLPSKSEGFSISLVEAMLAGLPCIATDQGGPVEIIENSNTGFLINPFNPDDLKRSMSVLLNMSKVDRIKIGDKAKIRGQDYSVENYINRLMEVYKGHG